MSSCTAVIAVLPDLLVGGHFTMDRSAVGEPARHVVAAAQKMKDLIGDQLITRLLIVGHNDNHNPQNIRDQLGCGVGGAHEDAEVEAYDIARKKVDNLVVIATFVGPGLRPTIQFKRQDKVTEARLGGPPANREEMSVYDADINVSFTLHTLRKHFVTM
ncbi:hypothetical protein OOT46_09135 [Aquabacterium sp. A7-Y]|uniref:hypothetical protein n=1 Tax=Aquabacterium sp. A7-Y TaxID=1349605 RepID=UPI00223DFE0B|nr:hypothetical protein [Aquabacterium sp. A7-Y]MCW7538011.1 hypothetical protein [Aquabacterium sp. A7-Y]